MFNPLSSLVPPSPPEDALLAAVALSLLLPPLTWYERNHKLYRGCGEVPCHLE